MRIAVFFLCLCFLLLGGASAYVGAQQHSNDYRPAPHQENTAQLILNHPDLKHPVIADAAPDAAIKFIIANDVDDEDTNDLSARKDRLPARAHAVCTFLSGTVISKRCCKCFKTPPFFFRPVSDKCILQSVFRI